MGNIKNNMLLEKIIDFIQSVGCFGCTHFSDRLFMCTNKDSQEHDRLNNFNGCCKHSKIEEFENLSK